ncbi:MAG: hypothetical protein KDD61_16530, partial [Bdellovibrionales bacterium]|nr:hypothetical protein [Bdellovibrionales bacterium]
AGEQIRKISLYEEKLSELALQTILLASRHTTLLEAQEMLNSMVSPENRVSILRDSELGVAS